MFKVPFLEPCEGCGSYTEVETEVEYLVLNADLANLGDIVVCSQCECSGVISSDGDEQYCLWDEELCHICWSGVLERVKGMLKAG
jgi:hypothetical protein